MFVKRDRPLESIPPTEDATLLNMKRASLEAQKWRQCLQPIQQLPSPGDWGWQRIGDTWVPLWRTLPVVSEVLLLNVRCKCKGLCKGNCSCQKRSTQCSDRCWCSCAAGTISKVVSSAKKKTFNANGSRARRTVNRRKKNN